MAKDSKKVGGLEKTGNPVLDAQNERLYETSDHDKKRLRIALAVALAVHIVFLAVRLPAMMEEPEKEPEEEETTYVIQQVKFKPPPPPEPQPEEPPPPQPEARKIPIPDPTPREPEPLPPPPEPEPEPPDPEDVVEFVEAPMQAPPDLPRVDTDVEIPAAPPPPEPTGPIRVGGNVKAPVKRSGADPEYTAAARNAKVEGVVIIEAIIDKQGNVRSTKVLKDLPMGLAANAEQAVKRWRFRPATLNGKPVEVYYNLTVNFTLN